MKFGKNRFFSRAAILLRLASLLYWASYEFQHRSIIYCFSALQKNNNKRWFNIRPAEENEKLARGMICICKLLHLEIYFVTVWVNEQSRLLSVKIGITQIMLHKNLD